MPRINPGDICEIVGTGWLNDGRRVVAIEVDAVACELLGGAWWCVSPLQPVATRHASTGALVNAATLGDGIIAAHHLRPVRDTDPPTAEPLAVPAESDCIALDALRRVEA